MKQRRRSASDAPPQPSTTSTPLDATLVLLERARHGDAKAREVLAARYLGALRRFAHARLPARARGLMETDDLVQVTLMRALDRLDSFEFRAQGSFLAYLRTAVLNLIRDEVRRSQRWPSHVELSDAVPAQDPDPLEEAVTRESMTRYEEALRSLPADQREAFMLRIEMGSGYQEIAEAIGRPSAGAARMLVRRAITRLVEELRDSRAT